MKLGKLFEQTIVTHSFSSTILTALQSLPAHDIHVIVTESRPLYEGRRVAARLSERAIPTTVITDAQIGLFVPQADIALLGADQPDGFIRDWKAHAGFGPTRHQGYALQWFSLSAALLVIYVVVNARRASADEAA